FTNWRCGARTLTTGSSGACGEACEGASSRMAASPPDNAAMAADKAARREMETAMAQTLRRKMTVQVCANASHPYRAVSGFQNSRNCNNGRSDRTHTRKTSGSPSDLEDVIRHSGRIDRKSTRLNSSHVKSSYAVF